MRWFKESEVGGSTSFLFLLAKQYNCNYEKEIDGSNLFSHDRLLKCDVHMTSTLVSGDCMTILHASSAACFACSNSRVLTSSWFD